MWSLLSQWFVGVLALVSASMGADVAGEACETCAFASAASTQGGALLQREHILGRGRGVEPDSERSQCCLAALGDADQCGTCWSHSWAAPSEWCAESAAHCSVCSGTWCPGSEALPTEPTPSLAPMPTPSQPTSTAPPTSDDWVRGTWTTGYWDCCKPSCSWPGKGNTNRPLLSCDADTGEKLENANEPSVCGGAGKSAACADDEPFLVRERLSMGFSAIAVGGIHGLEGDANCGQCYELKFVDTIHPDGNWGGSHPDLVGKSMVIQVSNIGYDVNGEHSFDLQIPGAGQGIFTDGCTRQFPGYTSGDFDCDVNYGGCDNKAGCARLPQALRSGCEWRYDWYRWLVEGGQTNNPYVDFRRVQCPQHLTNISGAVPLDDDEQPVIDFGSYGDVVPEQ